MLQHRTKNKTFLYQYVFGACPVVQPAMKIYIKEKQQIRK